MLPEGRPFLRDEPGIEASPAERRMRCFVDILGTWNAPGSVWRLDGLDRGDASERVSIVLVKCANGPRTLARHGTEVDSADPGDSRLGMRDVRFRGAYSMFTS